MTNLPVLGEIMGDLIGHHRQLLHLGSQKREVLIAGDIHALSSLIEEESKIIRGISRLENERQKTVALLLAEWDVQVDQMTMSQLLDYVKDASQKEMLRSVQGELMGIMTELRQLNQLNKELIEQSLEFVNHSLEVIVENGNQHVTYHNQSRNHAGGSSKHGRSFFDTKA